MNLFQHMLSYEVLFEVLRGTNPRYTQLPLFLLNIAQDQRLFPIINRKGRGTMRFVACDCHFDVWDASGTMRQQQLSTYDWLNKVELTCFKLDSMHQNDNRKPHVAWCVQISSENANILYYKRASEIDKILAPLRMISNISSSSICVKYLLPFLETERRSMRGMTS